LRAGRWLEACLQQRLIDRVINGVMTDDDVFTLTPPDVMFGPEPEPQPHRVRRLQLVAAATAVATGLAFAGWGVVAAAASSSATNGFPHVHRLHAGSVISGSVAAGVDAFVVDISAYDGETGNGDEGTGMVLTSNGDILTNNHVVAGATAIRVKQVSTGRTYAADVVGTDAADDVALLKLRGASGLTTLNAADPSSVRKGIAVAAIGNALAKPGKPTVATGQITDTGQTITAGDEGGGTSERLTGMLQTDADVQSGDSGGPLVDSSGQVIGMDTAASAQDGGGAGLAEQAAFTAATGFAIPITKALSVAKQIASGHSSSTIVIGTRGRLGVVVSSAGLSFSDRAGASVQQVIPGSAAAAVGLQPGDVITAVGSHSIASPQDLTTAIHASRSGDRTTITWTDTQGTSHTATATLGSGPAE
jgi:S1-C subfamily serine protease